MKKILLLLSLATFSIQAQTLQNPTYGNLKLKTNIQSTTATKVNVQENDGTINTKPLSELDNYLEFASAVNLPVTGEQGKLYLTKDNNRLYRFNGTIYQELADNNNVKLTGDQTIYDTKSFNNLSTSNSSIVIDANSGGGGRGAIQINNRAQNFGLRIDQSFGSSTSAGILIGNDNNSNGVLVDYLATTGNGRAYEGRNVGVTTFLVDNLGKVIGSKFIKYTAPANNILLAGGGDLSQGTAFNRNFGTTAGTVVEGGTLGSNAYNSTAYLPLSGGALTGALIGTSANFSSDATSSAYKLEAAGVLGWKYSSTGDTTMYNRITGDYIDGIKYYSGSWTGTNIKSHIFYTGNLETEAVVVYNNGSVKINNLSGSGDGNIVASSDGTLKRGSALGSNAYSSTAYLPLSGGTLSGNITATGFFQSSDRRLKYIHKRDGDVAYFTWKDGRDSKTHIGYIAQEVQENHPNQVQADEKGILSVNYVEILVEKIRVLEKRIEQLEKSK